MPYDESWDTTVRDGWRLMTVEYRALAVAGFTVAALVIVDRFRMWKRTWRIEAQLRKMEKKIYILEMQESGRLTRLMMELNGKSRGRIASRTAAIDMDACDVSGHTKPPPTADTRPEREK
jgi:hypothetical protein